MSSQKNLQGPAISQKQFCAPEGKEQIHLVKDIFDRNKTKEILITS